MKKIIIFGGKGTAINIAESLDDANSKYGLKCELLGFAFDDESYGTEINGYPVLCKTTDAYTKYGKYDDVEFIFQMNHQNKMEERSQLVKSYNIPLLKWHTFIHPSAYVAKSVRVGKGCVILSHCAIHSNVKIGNHCTFSALTTIGHDTTIGDHFFSATHVCIGSSVQIERCVFFGQNTTVIGSVKIKENNLIGLGAVVVKDIADTNKIFVGAPAKPIKSIN